MVIMTRTVIRGALALLTAAGIVSCSENPSSVRPDAVPQATPQPRASALASAPQLVISQIYGGGGNSGATLKNDFIEIFNPGSAPVSVDGWSVQYASAAGTTWTNKTNLSGTVPPGGYYLIQEAAGAGGTVSLPTPDATGAIAMAAGAGKVALVPNTTALTGSCPTGAVNFVSYGTTATNCGAGTTATLTNTTAALRKDLGCAYTGNDSTDFAVGAPAPRNSASPVHPCSGAIPVGPLHHVLIAGPATVTVGKVVQLVATPQDSLNQTVSPATIVWSSSDPATASPDFVTVLPDGTVGGEKATPGSIDHRHARPQVGIHEGAHGAILGIDVGFVIRQEQVFILLQKRIYDGFKKAGFPGRERILSVVEAPEFRVARACDHAGGIVGAYRGLRAARCRS